jgi:poly-gamma-glutamate synthesis protein (capsule biosynthesis protein)
VSYNQYGGDSAEATADKIRREKTAGRTVIVYTHWGEEYRPATLNEKSLALIFVTAGADAILGSHPHVVQEDAIVAGVPVFYSLGNFIFDQYWNESVSRGLAVELIVGQDGITVGKRYVTASTFAGSTCLIED